MVKGSSVEVEASRLEVDVVWVDVSLISLGLKNRRLLFVLGEGEELL